MAVTRRSYLKRVEGLEMPCTICQRVLPEKVFDYDKVKKRYASQCRECKNGYFNAMRERDFKSGKRYINRMNKEVEVKPDGRTFEGIRERVQVGLKFDSYGQQFTVEKKYPNYCLCVSDNGFKECFDYCGLKEYV